MDKKEWEEYRRLKQTGVDLSKENRIKFNAGGASETFEHIIAKAIAAKLALEAGYRVDSEVDVPNGEVDLVIHSHPKRLSYAVEMETIPTPEIKKKKLQHYVYETGLDDMCLIDISDMDETIHGSVDYIRSELGL